LTMPFRYITIGAVHLMKCEGRRRDGHALDRSVGHQEGQIFRGESSAQTPTEQRVACGHVHADSPGKHS
jgi:hypothetical protein